MHIRHSNPSAKPGSTLHNLVNNVTSSYSPAAQRNSSYIINDIPEEISIIPNEDLLASVLSGLMNIVLSHTQNSCIRITAKAYGNVVLMHVKDDGCVNYDSISQNLSGIQYMAEKLGGYVGFTSYRNKLTTIAFSLMNQRSIAA